MRPVSTAVLDTASANVQQMEAVSEGRGQKNGRPQAVDSAGATPEITNGYIVKNRSLPTQGQIAWDVGPLQNSEGTTALSVTDFQKSAA